MSLTVCQIDDPYAINVIYSCEVTLEEDGSLDTTQIEFVNEGDTFVGYPDPKDGKAYNPLIHHTLPSTISPTKLRKNLRLINGAPALPLISLSDYDKALSRRIAQQKEATSSRDSSIIPPREVKRPEKTNDNTPTRSYLLPRRLLGERNSSLHNEPSNIVVLVRLQRVEDPGIPPIKTWNVHLEWDFSMDTTKFIPLQRDTTFYGRVSNGEYHPFIENDRFIVNAGTLEYYLHETPGIPLPVLSLMSATDYLAELRKRKVY